MEKQEIKRHPGVHIKESLEAMNIGVEKLAERTGLSEELLNNIIDEKEDIDFNIAYKLSTFLVIQ